MHPISDSHIFICSKCDSDIRSLVLRNPLIHRLKCKSTTKEEGETFKEVRIIFGGSKNFLVRVRY